VLLQVADFLARDFSTPHPALCDAALLPNSLLNHVIDRGSCTSTSAVHYVMLLQVADFLARDNGTFHLALCAAALLLIPLLQEV
jgi:hypothetical protein